MLFRSLGQQSRLRQQNLKVEMNPSEPYVPRGTIRAAMALVRVSLAGSSFRIFPTSIRHIRAVDLVRRGQFKIFWFSLDLAIVGRFLIEHVVT